MARCKSRFWEHLYILLFLIGCWLWLFLAIPCQISFKEQTGAFIMEPGIWSEYLSRPAFLSSITGDFLMQFFWFRLAGPSILCVLMLMLWLGAAKALIRCGVERIAYLLALIPVAAEMSLVSYLNYPVSATVAFVVSVWLSVAWMWLRERIGKPLPAFLVLLILTAVSFPFLTGGHTLTMLVACSMYSLRKEWIQHLSIPAYLLLILVFSKAYQLSVAGCLVYPVTLGYKIPATVFLAVGPVSLIAAALIGLVCNKPWIGIIISSISLFFGILLTYNYMREYMVRMNACAYRKQWDKVWRLAVDAPDDMFFGTFYRNVCLARRSELPDRLLEYPQLSDGGMNVMVEPGSDYLWLFASIDQLMEVGDVSQATGCALLCQTIMPGGRSTHMLRRLSELAMVSGDYDVAHKYLNMLSHTIVHRKWARNMCDSIASGQLTSELMYYRGIASKTDRMFLQSDWTGSLNSLAETNPGNKTAIDYLLCSHLLAKQSQQFTAAYDKYYLNRFDRVIKVPELYQQALVTLITDQKSFVAIVSRYGIDKQITDRYQEFLAALEKSGGALDGLGEFKGTYWYYMVSRNLSGSGGK